MHSFLCHYSPRRKTKEKRKRKENEGTPKVYKIKCVYVEKKKKKKKPNKRKKCNKRIQQSFYIFRHFFFVTSLGHVVDILRSMFSCEITVYALSLWLLAPQIPKCLFSPYIYPFAPLQPLKVLMIALCVQHSSAGKLESLVKLMVDLILRNEI